MNTNAIGREGCFYATVTSADGLTWGFSVAERHGKVFTVALAEEMLAWANQEFKKERPKGYNEQSYNPDAVFIKLKYDMTDYREIVRIDGELGHVPVGKKRIGTFNSDKKLLRIWENGLPIYENNNGVICRDPYALADSIM